MRMNFVAHMIVLMSIFLAIALSIQTTPFFRWVLWGLFVYIIGKELVDEFRQTQKPDQDAAIRQQIMDKLNKIIAQVKKIV
jgi:hypothetical protein